MELWKIWLLGVVISIITGIIIHITENIMEGKYKHYIYIIVISSIIIVGGIADGWLVGSTVDFILREYEIGSLTYDTIIAFVILNVICIMLTYVVGRKVLGFKYFKNELLFIVIFIISIIVWSFPFYSYYSSEEIITETIVTSEENRKLIIFYDIPLQEISGNISGSQILGSGSISGNISTSNEVPYWYENENNNGVFDTAPTRDCELVFVENIEMPYVQIINYRTQTTTINYFVEKQDTIVEREWTEYFFYLPKTLKHDIN